tara:strand:- start:2966 stop:3226 length:261 start_codon:yes stop_codon:yes gene_type:complete
VSKDEHRERHRADAAARTVPVSKYVTAHELGLSGRFSEAATNKRLHEHDDLNRRTRMERALVILLGLAVGIAWWGGICWLLWRKFG